MSHHEEDMRTVLGEHPRPRIYVASKTRHAPMWKRLRADGAPIISTWLDEAGVGETLDFVDLAVRCVREASTATALVLYCEPEDHLKGALIEAGAALSAGVPVYCVGTCPSVGGALVKHPLWRMRTSVAEAIAEAAHV